MDRERLGTAFLSGRLGQVIFNSHGNLYAMTADSPPRLAEPAELGDACSLGAEYEVLHDMTLGDLQSRLHSAVENYNALFLVLSLLDLDVSLSTRICAAQSAEELLSDHERLTFVSTRLLSLPLPVTVRSSRHQITRPWIEFERIKVLLSEVFDSQAILDELWAAWTKALEDHPADKSAKISLEALLVGSGLFRDAVKSVADHDHQRFNSLVIEHAMGGEIGREMGDAKSILMAFRSEVQSKLFVSARKATQKALKLKKAEPTKRLQRTSSGDRITDLINGLQEGSLPRGRYIGALEAKASVDKQISAIRGALLAGKTNNADTYLEDLLAYQLGQGDREHAAMSLCSLTSIAIEANQLEMADRLSIYAIRLTSEDEVVFTSRAEVLKHRGYFDAALKAYEEAIKRFGHDRWALNGYADVLKEKKLFDESTKRYREIQNTYVDDPVAFNGEVSVLKAKGDHRAALNLALKNAKRFEFDSVTRGILAACMGALGKFDEALRQYKIAIDLDWSNVRNHVAYLYTLRENGDIESALKHADSLLAKAPDSYRILNVKAVILRGAGRLNDAKGAFEMALKVYPTYAPSIFGLSALRLLENQVEEARETLPDQNMESELDWFGFRLRALSFARAGDFRRTAPRLAFGLKHCPWARENSRLTTALGFVELQRGDLDRSIGLLNRDLDKLEMRDQQARLVLLAHAHAKKGAKDISRFLLGRRFVSKEPTLKGVRDSLIHEYELPISVPHVTAIDRSSLLTREFSMAMAA